MSLNEFIVEDAALEWFGEMGYAVGHGPHLAPGEPAAERDSFGEVVQFRFAQTLTPPRSHGKREKREAIRRLNPAIPEEAREEAFRRCCGWGRLRWCRRIGPFTGCCAMAHRWSIPGPMAASRAIMCGWWTSTRSSRRSPKAGLTKKESREDRARSGGIAVSLLGG
jgi:hypothetical protein